MRKFFREFKEFISRGNIIDMAVAFVISTAFTAIVNALVNNIIMPLITAIFGEVDVTALSGTLNGTTIPYGLFIQAVINESKRLHEKGEQRKVTKEEKAEIAALGTVDMNDRKAVYAAAIELRQQKKEAAEAEAKRAAETAETTENLLKQIRDLLAKQETTEKKAEPKTKK